jgi:hypothetical protein
MKFFIKIQYKTDNIIITRDLVPSLIAGTEAFIAAATPLNAPPASSVKSVSFLRNKLRYNNYRKRPQLKIVKTFKSL